MKDNKQRNVKSCLDTRKRVSYLFARVGGKNDGLEELFVCELERGRETSSNAIY